MMTGNEEELLQELRSQLQGTQVDDFDDNRSAMIALVDQLRTLNLKRYSGADVGRTLTTIENAFLKGLEQVLSDTPISFSTSMPPEEKSKLLADRQKLQHQELSLRFNDLSEQITPLHAGAVLALFSQLEFISGSVIRALLALVRTVKPASVKDQCPWLPQSLINAAEMALKADKLKAGQTMTSKGKPAVRAAWIECRFHQRRAKRGELGEFCEKMAKEHNCEASTIRNNWIPKWRKELDPRELTPA